MLPSLHPAFILCLLLSRAQSLLVPNHAATAPPKPVNQLTKEPNNSYTDDFVEKDMYLDKISNSYEGIFWDDATTGSEGAQQTRRSIVFCRQQISGSTEEMDGEFGIQSRILHTFESYVSYLRSAADFPPCLAHQSQENLLQPGPFQLKGKGSHSRARGARVTY
ncbi:hypothetical protein BDZ45DRAFT_694984 [Acephala macrosclerotiorum]|nr:hypothetical protein BDZ45DRAFT_694984 [Acephala macrosclerotiorum]